MTRMQYRLCDGYCDPPDLSDRFHTEILYRLPNSQWCYRSFISIDPSETPPFLQNGFITFGSFNHIAKLSKTVRRLWGEILVQMPSSRLVVVGVPEGCAKDDLLQDLEDAGVSVKRVHIVPPVMLNEYFRWFNAVDIALDTTPYSGGTTSCDALWMGVPIVTMPGSRSISRSAASILSAVGLSEWIASTPQDYIRKAVEFAQQDVVIANLRMTLRQRMRESSLMDEARFARDIEVAYRSMWRAWCSGTAQ
jgi:predicted O-linked N-acetylglucosamine transferase (SPINDLY family)